MTYAAILRLCYIDWRLVTTGTIRREHISSTFAVSPSVASLDLNAFIAAHPAAMKYDKSEKCYVPSRLPYRSVRGHDDPEVRRAIRMLARAGHALGWGE